MRINPRILRVSGEVYNQKQKDLREHENYLAWLHGAYVREAAWGKKYPSSPHEMKGEYREPTAAELREKIQRQIEARRRKECGIFDGGSFD